MKTKDNVILMEEDFQKRDLRRKITLTLISFICVATIIIICNSFIARAGGQVKIRTFKYYTEVRIGHQDTLWKIANEYITDEYESIDDYVDEVMSINSLLSPEDLKYGQKIIVPYYSSEWKQ